MTIISSIDHIENGGLLSNIDSLLLNVNTFLLLKIKKQTNYKPETATACAP